MMRAKEGERIIIRIFLKIIIYLKDLMRRDWKILFYFKFT